MTRLLYRAVGLSIGLDTAVCIVPRCTELGIHQRGWVDGNLNENCEGLANNRLTIGT